MGVQPIRSSLLGTAGDWGAAPRDNRNPRTRPGPRLARLYGRRLGALAGLLLATWGCGMNRPPTAAEAARLVQNSGAFATQRAIVVNQTTPGPCSLAATTNEHWLRLRELGVIDMREHRSGNTTDCEVVLTEDARRSGVATPVRDARADELPASAPGSQIAAHQWTIPLASKVFLKISEIRRISARTAEADFSWQWEPTETGRQLGIEPQVRISTATFWLSDSGWRTDSVSP